MKRKTTLIMTIIVAFLVSTVPIGLLLWYTYHETMDTQLEITINEAIASSDKLSKGLARIEKITEPLKTVPAECSTAVINKLIEIEYTMPEVRLVGLVSKDGKLICTSHGLNERFNQDEYTFLLGKHGLKVSGPVKNHLIPQPVMVVSNNRDDGNYIIAVVLPQTTQKYLSTRHGKDGFSAITREDHTEFFTDHPHDTTGVKLLNVAYLKNDTIVAKAKFNDGTVRTLVSNKVDQTGDIYVTIGVTENWLLHSWYRLAMFQISIAIIFMIAVVFMAILVTKRRLSLSKELERAIKHNELRVYYQPVIDLQTNRCVGAEALLRWLHPERDIIRPDLFVPLAEASGMIVPITEWLIDTVIDEFGQHLKNDKDMHIAINLSPNHFDNGQIIEDTNRHLKESGVDYHQIIYEITERSLIPNKDQQPREIMEKLKSLNAQLALDDFGTGYSSLSYLSSFPLDYLKIDKIFTESIGTGAITENLVDSIIAMAKNLNLSVIAEGIETKEQLEHLKKNGVSYGQGWYYSQPLPFNEFIAFMINFNNH